MKKKIVECHCKWTVLFLKQQGFNKPTILALLDGKEFNRMNFPRKVTDSTISTWMSDTKKLKEARRQCVEDFLEATSEQERDHLVKACRKVSCYE
jgi:hypothetical protein